MKTIEIDPEMASFLDEIRGHMRTLAERGDPVDLRPFPDFNLDDDSHLIQALVGTTARMFRVLVNPNG